MKAIICFATLALAATTAEAAEQIGTSCQCSIADHDAAADGGRAPSGCPRPAGSAGRRHPDLGDPSRLQELSAHEPVHDRVRTSGDHPAAATRDDSVHDSDPTRASVN
jgi:hypothetical protein